MNKITLRILSILFILCVIVCVPVAWPADALTLLHRDTWSFSAEEIKTLNAIDRKVMGPEIASIIKNVTGHKDEDPLMDFKVIDLNELVRCDPILAFPEIYVWTGSKCKIVSKQYWPYYRDHLLSLLTNGIFEIKNTNFRSLGPELKHCMAVEAVNWALATDKLNEMFPEEPAVKDSVKKYMNC